MVNCKALRTKGIESISLSAPLSDPLGVASLDKNLAAKVKKSLGEKAISSRAVGATELYSAGFYAINAQKSSFYKCEALDNIYGFVIQNSGTRNPLSPVAHTIRECRADNNDAAGFVDTGFPNSPVGTSGTVASPGVSTSLFQNNTAYNNGDGATHIGPNGNYQVYIDPAFATTPLPTFRGQISTVTYGYFNPLTFTPIANISTIQ